MGGISDKMAGVSECGTLRGTDEMVGQEIIRLFTGRYYGILGRPLIAGIDCGSVFLRIVISYDSYHHRTYADLGRSGVRMAVIGVYHIHGERNSIILHRDRGRISV